MNVLDRYAGTVYCIMRIIVGLLFACHGGQKVLGFPMGGHGAGQGSMMLLGAWIELIAGFLVAAGLVTRPAAFLASGQMAYAYFFMHASGAIAAKMGKPFTSAQQHFFPILNAGESALVYCIIFLFIFFHGPGWLSLDALIWKAKAREETIPVRA